MAPSLPLCPQCGAPLPRQARWRVVSCPYCAAQVSASSRTVDAAWFKQAWQRANDLSGEAFACAGERYRVLAPLASGAQADILLAQRCGALAERVVLKVARADACLDTDCAPLAISARLQRERVVLDALQDPAVPGAAYFTQRLPQALDCAPGGPQQRPTLVLRHPPGLWGSLAALRAQLGAPIDARHLVWLWRRTLEVLGCVHASGWVHGNLHPGHLLVQPADHGVVLIGWGAARRYAMLDDAAFLAARTRDLRQAAWSMRALLANDGALDASVPAPLAQLLWRASEADAPSHLDAGELAADLTRAAAAAFGPPRFLDLRIAPQRAAALATSSPITASPSPSPSALSPFHS